MVRMIDFSHPGSFFFAFHVCILRVKLRCVRPLGRFATETVVNARERCTPTKKKGKRIKARAKTRLRTEMLMISSSPTHWLKAVQGECGETNRDREEGENLLLPFFRLAEEARHRSIETIHTLSPCLVVCHDGPVEFAVSFSHANQLSVRFFLLSFVFYLHPPSPPPALLPSLR